MVKEVVKVATVIKLDAIDVSTSNGMFRQPHEVTPEALNELAENIRQYGVLQAILVRPHQEMEGRFIIVFGERRFRASIQAGKEEIPAYLTNISDELALEIQVIENLQRVDVHPVNEAKGYKFMLEKDENMTTADLAIRFAKSETYILQRLKLNDLVHEVKKDFMEEKMLLGHAIMIARLTPQDQRETREQMIRRRSGYGTVGELDQFIEHNIMNSLSTAPFDKKDETLYKKAGACQTCPKRSGASPMLFADIKQKDKCFDKNCFFTKCHKHLINSTKEIIETEPEITFLKDYNEPVEEVMTLLNEQKITPIIEYTDFSQQTTGGKKVRGLWISGSKAGQLVTVFLKKVDKKMAEGRSNTEDQIEKIKHRLSRGKELDREKIYGKILEALHQHPSQKKGFDRRMMPSEEVLLWFLVYDKAGYHIRHELDKLIGIGKSDPAKLYKRIKTMKHHERAFILRKVMLDQYGGNYPESNQGYIIYRVATEYRDIDIAGFQKEQQEICEKRETRAKQKIKELQSANNKAS